MEKQEIVLKKVSITYCSKMKKNKNTQFKITLFLQITSILKITQISIYKPNSTNNPNLINNPNFII